MTGKSVPTVRRAVSELKAAGVLTTTRTGKASRYEFRVHSSLNSLGVTHDPSEGSPMTHHDYKGPFPPVVGEDLEMEQ